MVPDKTVHLYQNFYQLTFILFQPSFRFVELVLPWYFVHIFNFVHTLQYFICFEPFQQPTFLDDPQNLWPTCSAAACPPFSKSPTINISQLSKRDSIFAEKSLDFRIIIERSSYSCIGRRSDILYDLLVVGRSYEDQIRNVSNSV